VKALLSAFYTHKTACPNSLWLFRCCSSKFAIQHGEKGVLLKKLERFGGWSGLIPVLASGCNDGGCSLAEFSATAQNFVVRFSLDERTGSEFHITKDIMKSGAFKITKYHDPTRCGCREKKVPKLRGNKS